MKRILFSAHNGNMGGGAERSLLEIIQYLTQHRKEIDILVATPFEGSFTEALTENHIPFITQPIPYAALPEVYPKRESKEETQKNLSIGYANAQLKALKTILDFKPDLVVSNTIVIPWFIRAAKTLNIPAALFVRELFDKRNGVRNLLPDTNTYVARLLNDSSHLFFNSCYTESLYAEFSTDKPSSVVYPSISIPSKSKNEAKSSQILTNDSIKIIILGNITPHKNQLQVVEAIATIKNQHPSTTVHLTIMGSAENNPAYVQQIEQFIKANHLKELVTFTPFSDSPYSTVLEHDILVMASSNEAFGRVTLEGQLLRRLVIGADSAGTKEIITDQETGLLYREGDSKDLAKKIIWATENRKKSQEIARKSHHISEEKFSQENSIKPFISYLDSLEGAHYPNTLLELIGYDEVNFMLRNEHIEEKLGKYGSALSEAAERISQLESQVNQTGKIRSIKEAAKKVITKIKN